MERVQGRGVFETYFKLYALLATRFDLTIRQVEQQWARRNARKFIAALTRL